MLLEFCLELIRGGPELSTELLHLTKNSLWNFLGMFKALQFLRFWVYQKILLDFFVELICGGTELSTELLYSKKKIFSKFFEYVQSTVVSWILSLSKNVTRVIPRTHPRWGPELSTELLHLTKNSLWNFLGMFIALQFLRFWIYQKILLDFSVELIWGGTELSTELLDLKKNFSKFFWVRLKYCSFLDFEFIETCYSSFS